MKRLSWLAAVFTLMSQTYCQSKQRPHDDALKKQILSGDHAPLRIPAPDIAVHALATDLHSRKAVFTDSITVLERRLPFFQLRTKLTLDGGNGIGNRTFEHQLREGARDAFSIHHAAPNAESVDWIVVDHKAFVKHGKGVWRSKPYTLQHTETLKNEIPVSLSELYTLFADTLAFTEAGEATEAGRAGVRYTIESGDKVKKIEPALLLRNEAEPVQLSGTCVIDRDTGALLVADIKATVTLLPMAPASKPVADDAPPPPPAQTTLVKLRLTWNIDSLAADDQKKLVPEAPADAEQDKGFDRPPADALGFWQTVKPTTNDDKEDDD